VQILIYTLATNTRTHAYSTQLHIQLANNNTIQTTARN